MGSRKKIILASLVSLMMILAFAVGLAPSQGRDSILDAKAASGVDAVAISADGTAPTGNSFAIPVGGEQSFSALGLKGGVATQLLTTGGVEWSLGTDGKAVLSSAPGDAVATVTALAPGSANLFVNTADGLSSEISLTFYELKAAKTTYPSMTSLTIMQPIDGAHIFLPADATNVPMTVTSVSDSPADTKPVSYTLTNDVPVGTSDVFPYAVTIADIANITTETITAASGSYLSGLNYTDSATFTVTKVNADTNGNGLPDDPFSLPNFAPGDLWYVTVPVDGGGTRTVLMANLNAPVAKATALTNEETTVSWQDPAQPERIVSVTVPAGLINSTEQAVLVLQVADNLTTLLGATEAGKVASPLLNLVGGGTYAEVSILVKATGATTFAEIDDARLALKPLTLVARGVALTAGDNARFLSYPTNVISDPTAGMVVEAVASASWTPTSEGTTVGVGTMTASLTSLSLIAPFATPANVQLVSLSESSDFSIGGKTVTATLANAPLDAVATITIDGTTVSTTPNGPGAFQFAVPPAATRLANPAASATYGVRVDITSVSIPSADSFDTLPNGFTYLGPRVDAMNPDSGTQAGGTAAQVTGAGFSSVLAASLDGSPILVSSVAGDGASFLGTTTAHSVGQTTLTVTTDKNYTGTRNAAFTFLPNAPQLTSVFPSLVLDDGGYSARLRGLYFVDPNTELKVRGDNQVFFTANVSQTTIGDVDPGTDNPAANVTFLDDMNLDILTPAHAVGDFKVYARTFIPSNQPNKAFGPKFGNVFLNSTNVLDFSFASATAAAQSMYISSVDPNFGPLSGGNPVVINGFGFPIALPLGDVTTGNVLRFGTSSATQFFANTDATIDIPIYLFRGADLASAPSSAFATAMSFSIKYDPTVLEAVKPSNTWHIKPPADQLNQWYNMGIATNVPAAGEVTVAIQDTSGSGAAITTVDDQRGSASTNVQTNPLPFFTLRFKVIGAAGAYSYLSFDHLRMLNGLTDLTTDVGQPSFFNVGSASMTPPVPAKVYFGTNPAALTLAKAAGQYGSLTVAAPAGERPGTVDVRVEDAQDSTRFAISRANSIYSSTDGGYTYTSSLNVTSIAPSKAWLFGGVVAHIQGSGFQYTGGKTVGTPATKVYFSGIEAAYAPTTLYTNDETNLYVIVPPLTGTTDSSPAEIDVNVTVTNPAVAGKTATGESVTLQNAFTYVRWNQKAQAVPGAVGDVFTTSFFFDNLAGTSKSVVLYNNGAATFTVPENILSAAVKTDAPVFALARATQTPELFGTENIVTGNALYSSWNFDIHLYNSTYPFDEVSVALNTTQTPMTLTFPMTNTGLLVGDITNGGTSLFSIESALDYTNFDNPAYTLLTTNTGGLITAYQSNVSGGEYLPNVLTPASTPVTQVTSRIYSLSAFALRTNAPMSNPNAATVLANASGPLNGGTLVTFTGNGIGWPIAVTFGTVEADVSLITNRSEFGFTIPAPAGLEVGTVPITITLFAGDVTKATRVIPAGFFTYTPTGGGDCPLCWVLGLIAALFGLLSGGGGHGGGGPCFIATAAYGTPLADQIDTLRAFRDTFLLDNAIGTALVDAYYRVSPAIADVVAQHTVVATAVRVVLLPVILMAKFVLALPHVSFALGMLGAAMTALRLRKRSKA